MWAFWFGGVASILALVFGLGAKPSKVKRAGIILGAFGIVGGALMLLDKKATFSFY